MPPFVPRKRSRSPENHDKPPPSKRRAVPQSSKATKTTLFNAIDTPQSAKRSAADSQRFLDKVGGGGEEDSDSGSNSASEVDSDDFEDVQPALQEDDQEDDVQWENAIDDTTPAAVVARHDDDIQDVSISVKEDGTYIEPMVSGTAKKKGPSKRERLVRSVTHTLHVQALMWHNTVRNSWLNDSEVQKTLIAALPPGINHEIKRWKRDMGMLSAAELQKEKAAAAKASKARSKKNGKKHDLGGRDWTYSADHAEAGSVNMSHGDPLLRLLKCLSAYWKKRFVIIAPGIRKRGYMPLRKLREQIRTWEAKPSDHTCGERIESLSQFRRLAKLCEGSRDVGAQLFVALLRGLKLEVRMVANLQPAGFGFSKAEEAVLTKPFQNADPDAAANISPARKPVKKLPPPKLREALTPKQGRKPTEKIPRNSATGNRSAPIDLDDTDSSLSDLPPTSDDDDASDSSISDMSIIDVTPVTRKPSRKFDRDLQKPVYWAEVLSALSNNWIPVDAVVMRTIANNNDLLQSFEPRGSQADRGRQVICYTIAFSADGTAKDVTVRYLKKHQIPGKTKGVRMPVEKVPIYNRKGKVKKYEEYDWFHELMLRYARPQNKRTTADDAEDNGVLKPFRPSTEKKVFENESLAWYKASADYVLAEHLRREEALLPGSEPIRTFAAGKGDKARDYQVYKREDVVACKTVESWHKEGRGLLPGEQPMKYVPIRAVTLQRKREIEDAQRETGEKPQQGLYSIDQTDWIIPDPIVDGIIPVNAYNNIDVFAPSMVPRGSVHLPLKGVAKLCRRLNINHAEACTGFEFGKQRAVPVISGVVVATENAARVKQAWREEQAEIKRKEDIKRTAAALHWWRKMLLGMRVIDRMKADYELSSDQQDAYNPFVRKAAKQQDQALKPSALKPEVIEAGGFILSDDEDNNAHAPDLRLESPEQHHEGEAGDELLLTENPYKKEHSHSTHLVTPVSLQNLHDETLTTPTFLVNGRGDVPTSKARSKTSIKASTKKATSSSSESALTSASEGKTSDTSVHATLVKPTPKAGRNGHARGLKATPRKSPYFSSQEPGAEEDSDPSEESIGEVITLRRTTARTRGAQ